MKKLLSILAIVVSAISLQAQTKAEKDLKALEASVEGITKMLSNDYIQIMSVVDVVSSTTFTMGECLVLTGVTDEAFKNQVKKVEVEFNQMLGKSIWSFDKYDRANQTNVKVTPKNGNAESVAYNGFPGRATVSINSLIEGITIEFYLYQNKKDKNLYMMTFSDRGMSFFFDMTKVAAGNNQPEIKNNATDAATGVVPKVVPKTQGLKNKANSKLLNKIKK